MGRAKDTAELTAFARAAGAVERKDLILKDPDDMARQFLSWQLGLLADLCRLAPLRELIDRAYEKKAPGAARFLLARTKHFDRILLDEVALGLEQLVVLGAGYDTRAYRFEDKLAGARVFELDHPDTSRRKIAILMDRHGKLPPHVDYVPINFVSESLEEKLLAAGYDVSKRTFFLWEGVSYYLEAVAVDGVLNFVRTRAGAESAIAFDYMYQSVIDGKDDLYGAREILERVRKLGEPLIFGIPQDGAVEFLASRGFELISDCGPEKMERAYLADESGERHGRVCGFFSIAHARVSRRG